MPLNFYQLRYTLAAANWYSIVILEKLDLSAPALSSKVYRLQL